MEKGFDLRSFDKATFTMREEEVSVDSLAHFFPEGEKPVFKVRGLTATEFSKCREINSNLKTINALSEALLSEQGKEITEKTKKLMGIGDDVPIDIAYRIQILVEGLVVPKLERNLIVKFGEVYPTEFYMLSNKIIELTGQGQVPGKQKPSGKKKLSKPVS